MKRLLISWAMALLLIAPAQAEKWAVLIGVDEYETRQITPLNFAVRDVTAVSKVLERTGVPPNNIFLLTDKGKGRSLATGNNILWRMGQLSKEMVQGDTLYFYFSGHGLERDGETYLLSYDSDIGNSVVLKRSAVRMSELKDLTKTMKASNIITFMDACRNNPEAGKSVSSPNALSKGMAKDLSLIDAISAGAQKKMNVTFFSCSPGERSWESEETSQGFFSYHVMKGLLGEAADANGKITVNSLEEYLSREVPPSVNRMIGQQQTPWTNREGTAGGSFVLALGTQESAQRPAVEPQVAQSVSSSADVPVHPPTPHSVPMEEMAVLVVYDSGIAEQSTVFQSLVASMAPFIQAYRSKQQVTVPSMLSYNFQNLDESLYCINKLKMIKSDLPFIGVIKLNKRMTPTRILYGVRGVSDSQSASKSVWEKIL